MMSDRAAHDDQASREQLEKLLRERLASGSPTPMSEADFEQIRGRLSAHRAAESNPKMLHVVFEFNTAEEVTPAATVWLKRGNEWAPSRSSPEFEDDPNAFRIIGPVSTVIAMEVSDRLLVALRELGHDPDLIETADD